ncbi:hypothetical protein Ahy_B01g052328 [Arachis hypogaea]|uniref:Aminotransferase-like plant mobile domain-containing protein n=1 Tax=Arachis hypogaea TaxID=3818 RepID=A0A445AP53_ARAHY|nr:hypothetical protein Ahy_B01g052328 [Arachis hypogaea]
MCRVANRNMTNLASPQHLLQPHGFDDFSFPLASRWATYLPTSDGKEQRMIKFRLALDRLGGRDCYNAACSSHFQIVWEPYASLDVFAAIHPEILTEENSRLWRAVISLIYFAVLEWHQVDRFGGVQHVPDAVLNIDYLHSKNSRGGDRWFPSYYQTWHEHWEQRVSFVLSI